MGETYGQFCSNKKSVEEYLKRKTPDKLDEITRLRLELARLQEALLFVELMASEMGIDAQEKCQKIYDHLHAIRYGD